MKYTVSGNDRLIEDNYRREKGAFYTPKPFADLAHKYITDIFGVDWKERFVVWDCACGEGALTKDYQFNELYCSTLELPNIETMNELNYNNEANKFQYDFLNDTANKLPLGLQNAINSGKEMLFLINPPYATSGNNKRDKESKKGVSITLTQQMMKNEGWGASSQNLYAQFLYSISKMQEINKNIKIAIFSPPLFLSGGSYKSFRTKFFNLFGFEKGFLFEANHFADVKGWGITFSIFGIKNKNIKTDFLFDIIDFNKSDYTLEVLNHKVIYNTDNLLTCGEWIRKDIKGLNSFDAPQMSSSIKWKEGTGRGVVGMLGSFRNESNSVYENATGFSIFSSSHSHGGTPFIKANFDKAVSLFTARKTIQTNWINCKDEYLAPNEQHIDYEQFTNDSLVYSLFNNSSQQSSLRQIDYKGKKWNIKNEFFWLSKKEMLDLSETNNYENLYKDARTSDERFVYKKLFQEGIYEKLSPDAKEVLDIASDLVRKSFKMRKLVSENHSEYHLDSWDCSYAQLKLVWKEYFKEEFKVFRDKYKELENRLRPLVYTLGFLKQ